MSRKYRITGVDLGSDIQNVEVYHTAVTASNLLFGPVTRSLLISPGYTVEVDDDVTTFIARCVGGSCNLRTGSLNINYSPNTRLFTVVSDGEGYVSSTAPTSIANVTGSFTSSVNYAQYSFFNITADASYYPGKAFEGWYNAVSGSGTLLSTSASISIGRNDFTSSLANDTIFAYFG